VLMPTHLPAGLYDFLDKVVPELQRRGLFQAEYRGKTLREHLGLSRPARGSGARRPDPYKSDTSANIR
jgi:hypothetical protein